MIKPKKNDYNDINKVIKYIESGVLKEETLVRWVSRKKESIYKDMLDINASYKNGSVLKYFNVNQWLYDKNQIVTEFRKSCSGLTNDNTNSKMGLSLGVCEKHRRRPACASAQSDQRLCCSHLGKKLMLTCYR